MNTLWGLIRRDVVSPRRRNDALPINRLPLEIFLRILHFSLEFPIISTQGSSHYKRLLHIMGVSHRWRRFVCHEPSFWTLLSSCNSEDFIRDVLERSKSSLLDVYFHVHEGTNLMISSLRFSSIITEYARRLRSTNIVLDRGIDWTRSHERDGLFASSFPALQSLTIYAHIDNKFSLPFFKNAVGLRSISLNGVLLPRDFHVNSLTWLEFKHPPIRGSLRLFLDVIASLRSLAGLLIEAADFADDLDVENSETILLSSLRTLKLTYLSYDTLERIVTSIDVPNCRQILLQASSHPASSRYPYLFQTACKWLEGMQCSSLDKHPCLIQFWRQTMTLQYESITHSRSFKVEIQTEPFSPFISALAECGLEDVTVELRPRECAFYQRDFLPSLARLPNVQTLQLEECKEMKPLMILLSAREQLPLPFPWLQRLVFVAGDGTHLDSVFEMIRSRYPPEVTHRPLLELKFKYDVRQQIGSILGEGMVTHTTHQALSAAVTVPEEKLSEWQRKRTGVESAGTVST